MIRHYFGVTLLEGTFLSGLIWEFRTSKLFYNILFVVIYLGYKQNFLKMAYYPKNQKKRPSTGVCSNFTYFDKINF